MITNKDAVIYTQDVFDIMADISILDGKMDDAYSQYNITFGELTLYYELTEGIAGVYKQLRELGTTYADNLIMWRESDKFVNVGMNEIDFNGVTYLV